MRKYSLVMVSILVITINLLTACNDSDENSSAIENLLEKQASIECLYYETETTWGEINKPTKPTNSSKLWQKGKNIRIDNYRKNTDTVENTEILDGVAMVAYDISYGIASKRQIEPEEMELALDLTHGLRDVNPKIIDSDTYNGMVCTILEYDSQGGERGNDDTTKMWIWNDYGIPVKVETMLVGLVEIEIIVEYKNISFDCFSDDIFNLPKGVRISGDEEYSTTEATFSHPIPSDIEMISILGGTLQMGSSDGDRDERPIHTVTVSPFSIAKYEVTYAQWMEVKKSAESHGYSFNNPGDMGSSNWRSGAQDETHPVTYIEWYDAVLWCNALSEIEGRVPCYYTSSAQSEVYRSGRLDMENTWVDWEANGYRLPTEAEWEYACRANTSTKYSFGDTITGHEFVFPYIYIDDKYYESTRPVDYYGANPWGLYGVHGNVHEMCWDWYDSDYYSDSPSDNPHGPSVATGRGRVARSGSWYDDAFYWRSSNRSNWAPDYTHSFKGFRPICSQ